GHPVSFEACLGHKPGTGSLSEKFARCLLSDSPDAGKTGVGSSDRQGLAFCVSAVAVERSASCHRPTPPPVPPVRSRRFKASQGVPVVGRTRKDVSTAETITWIKVVTEVRPRGEKDRHRSHTTHNQNAAPREGRDRDRERSQGRTGWGDRENRTGGFCGHTKHIFRRGGSATIFSRDVVSPAVFSHLTRGDLIALELI